MDDRQGPFLVTLRVDALDYDELRDRYSITLNNCVLSQHNKVDDNNKESTESIKFEVSDPSKIINTERGAFVSEEAGILGDDHITSGGDSSDSEDGVLIDSDKYFLIFWAVYIVIAILLFMLIEDDTFVDALYFRIVTAFGVGFGDIYPQTVAGKVLNCIFIGIDLLKMAYIDYRILTMLFKYRQHQYQVDTLPQTRGAESPKVNRFAKLVNNPHFVRYIVVMLFLWFLAGALMMCLYEGYGVLDALEWNVVTISQVGYGNTIPHTVGGKIFTVFYILFGYVQLVALAVIIFDVALGKVERRRSLRIEAQKKEDAKVELTGLLSQ